MIITRPPLWKRPAFGRLCNGTSNAMTTSTLPLSRMRQLAICWWEFSSSSAGVRCVMETGASGYPGIGEYGFAIFRNNAAAGYTDFAFAGWGKSSISYFPTPASGQWNHVACNINTLSGGSEAVPSAWVNGVRQTLSYMEPFGPVVNNTLNDNAINIGSRNAGSNYWNDIAISQIACIGGHQWSDRDAADLYRGAKHPELFLKEAGLGFVWQPQYAASPDLLRTAGFGAGHYATFSGMGLASFPQLVPA